MLVKIQLCVNLLWYSNGIAIGPEFSSMQAGSENFVLMSRLGRKWHISSLAFTLFSWNHLKSLVMPFVILFLGCIGFFLHYRECFHQTNLQYQ